MTHEVLQKLTERLIAKKNEFVRWRTIWRLSVAFYGLLRWDEVSRLRWSHLKIEGGVLRIWIERSKTDQRGVGEEIEIFSESRQTLQCPVFLTQQYGRRLGYSLTNSSCRDGFRQPRLDGEGQPRTKYTICLLYTSDAADE